MRIYVAACLLGARLSTALNTVGARKLCICFLYVFLRREAGRNRSAESSLCIMRSAEDKAFQSIS